MGSTKSSAGCVLMILVGGLVIAAVVAAVVLPVFQTLSSAF